MATKGRMKTYLWLGVGEDAAKAGLKGMENVCEIKVADILTLGTLSPVESTLMQNQGSATTVLFFPGLLRSRSPHPLRHLPLHVLHLVSVCELHK